MRLGIVFNPATGGDGDLRRDVTKEALKMAGVDFAWFETTKEDPGTGFANRAMDEGCDVIVACGGDGTVRACINAVAGSDKALAIVPAGTSNVLARLIGTPNDIEQAVSLAISGCRKQIDVARCEDQHFVIAGGLGFDAALLRDTDEETKAKIGSFAYVLSGLRHIKRSRTSVDIKLDGQSLGRHRVTMLLIGNYNRFGFLPTAAPDDGLLDIALVNASTLGQWVDVARRVLLRDRRRDARMQTHAGSHIEITASHPMPLELDGDHLGKRQQIDVTVMPRALTLLCADED